MDRGSLYKASGQTEAPSSVKGGWKTGFLSVKQSKSLVWNHPWELLKSGGMGRREIPKTCLKLPFS
jgi:hypothetical protein